MKKIFEKRTSVSVGDSSCLYKASWPFGRITLYSDRLVLKAGFKNFELMYKDIEYIKFMYFQVQIEHEKSCIPKHVDVNGFLIPLQIKNAIQVHRLPIVIR